MAIMTTEDREGTAHDYMRENTTPLSANGSVKPLLYQTIAAIDQWVHDNQASLIAALPTDARPAQGGYTAAQLAHMFTYVVRRRYIKGV